MRSRYPDDPEAALVALLRKLYAGDLTEGQLLRSLRRDVLGLSQTRYAEMVGISRRTLSDLERDTGSVTLEVMNRAFKPLGLEVSLVPRKRSLLKQALIPIE
ncbi:helix-turn-helix domain-containing protein [Halomonas campisalis]|uniref:Helix-turn-helix domain-containing protein n=1 Tax=Billgrantia campisalis TaxID=74661 RepID=A0ABS9P613_9GAMM|nr:helix-turn-helix domain-containing protein [Halomonas campisalis]MCG6657211.1 helix-turn-helix domain-containing protein [Halomonas campisalis]MDR5862396.1 helix-turn-helix domain-containing protein [Halomonas campisalis]